ncbi:MAG: hypothetical protein VB071_02185 [Lawsonibacter sp.]|nr:hypothetical protein [Lawsonibacter sp.]
MNVWTVYTIAFSAVLVQVWAERKRSRFWYLRGIVPLLYGAVVAGMFWEKDAVRSFQIIVFGGILPVLLLLGAWWDSRMEERTESPGCRDRDGAKT